MRKLWIEQFDQHGKVKVWRLDAMDSPQTFGKSRKANLYSPRKSQAGIQGVFEFREDGWYYINLDIPSQEKLNLFEVKVGTDTTIYFSEEKTSGLKLKVLAEKAPLFSTDAFDSQSSGTSDTVLVNVYQASQLLETRLAPKTKPFVSKFDPAQTKITFAASKDWQVQKSGDLEIRYRAVTLPDSLNIPEKNSSKKMMMASGALFSFLLLGLMMPKGSHVGTETTNQITTAELRLKPKPNPLKPKRKEQMAQAHHSAAAGPVASASQGAMASSKISNSALQSRISQLIGKISNSAARSKNLVIMAGTPAGSAPSGRSLASVGNVDRPGRDWSQDGKGQNFRISTSGKAGNGLSGGAGGLALGKTGSGGLGLLEEEGEITGGLDREVIASYIRSKLGEILYCYERQLSADPHLFGKIGVKFTIIGNGQVEEQKIGETTLKNTAVEGCILSRVSKWKFPTPEGGTKVLVTYPFLFKSTN